MKKLIATLIFSTVILADIGTLKRVVDGDTLYFYTNGKTVKCRIAYIDTPESHRNSRAKRKAKECPGVTLNRMIEAGKEAARHAKWLVSIGEIYRFDVQGRDRYGRSICVVHLPSGRTFNENMVQDGYATPFWKYVPSSLKYRFQKLTNEAKRKQTGLWREYRPIMECLTRRH